MYKSANINGLMAAYDEMVKLAGPIGTAVRWGKRLLGIGLDAAKATTPAVKKVVNEVPQASLSPGNFRHSNYGSDYAIKKLKDGKVVGFDQRSVDAYNRGEIGFNPDGTVWKRSTVPQLAPPAPGRNGARPINAQRTPANSRIDYANDPNYQLVVGPRGERSYVYTGPVLQARSADECRIMATPLRDGSGGSVYSSREAYDLAMRVELAVRNRR